MVFDQHCIIVSKLSIFLKKIYKKNAKVLQKLVESINCIIFLSLFITVKEVFISFIIYVIYHIK